MAASGNPKVFNRADLTRRLVGKLGDQAVIAGIGNANFDLFAAGHRAQNFYMLGSMGLACPIALGVALAQPERGVIALEGDGSLLMSLGCLATIATVAPRNLTLIIWDNGIYQITGKQPTATSHATDIVAVAQGAGIANSHWIRDRGAFRPVGRTRLRARRSDAPGRQDRRQARRDPAAPRPGAGPQPLHEGPGQRQVRGAGRLARRHVSPALTGTARAREGGGVPKRHGVPERSPHEAGTRRCWSPQLCG